MASLCEHTGEWCVMICVLVYVANNFHSVSTILSLTGYLNPESYDFRKLSSTSHDQFISDETNDLCATSTIREHCSIVKFDHKRRTPSHLSLPISL